MSFDAAHWDERYAARETVWGVEPNRWVAQELADLPPGRALDLACGEGRNAVWLAARGWHVVAVDFSAVALGKGADLEARTIGTSRIEWLEADATAYEPAEAVDLALLCYLQLEPTPRRAAVTRAARALVPGGTLLVIGHDTRNLTEGTGGPQDAAVLFTGADIAGDLAGTGLVTEQSGEALRPVEGAPRPAIDALLRARRPATGT